MGMMSDLTDDLMLRILSSLNFKDVVTTSVLSREWRSLWKLSAKLKIDENESRRKICWESISSSLISNPQLLKSLDLKLIPDDNERMIHSLVGTAVYHGLREVRIELLYTFLTLPICLYDCKTLETLILSRLELEEVPYEVSLSSLKTLGLLSVKFSCDESVKRLLSIFPLLEDLVVRRSTYVNVEVFTINVPTLTSLSIDYLSSVSQADGGAHGFVINAPSLRYLNIRDHFSNLLLFTSHMPEMLKANVELFSDQSQSLFPSLTSIPHLSLSSKVSYDHDDEEEVEVVEKEKKLNLILIGGLALAAAFFALSIRR